MEQGLNGETQMFQEISSVTSGVMYNTKDGGGKGKLYVKL